MKQKQKEKPRSGAESLEEIEKRNGELQVAAYAAKGIGDILHFVDLSEAESNREFSFQRCAGGLEEVANLLQAVLQRNSDIIEREGWALRKIMGTKN